MTGITGGRNGVGKIGRGGDLLGGVGSVVGGVTQGVGGLLGGVLEGLGGNQARWACCISFGIWLFYRL